MEWQGWGECNTTCGAGFKMRYRMCWNKDLGRVDDGCDGLANESQPCAGPCILSSSGNKFVDASRPGSQLKIIVMLVSVALLIVITLIMAQVFCRKSRSVDIRNTPSSENECPNTSSVCSTNSLFVSKHCEDKIIFTMLHVINQEPHQPERNVGISLIGGATDQNYDCVCQCSIWKPATLKQPNSTKINILL